MSLNKKIFVCLSPYLLLSDFDLVMQQTVTIKFLLLKRWLYDVSRSFKLSIINNILDKGHAKATSDFLVTLN